MTRNTAIKLLAAIAAAFTSNVRAQEKVRVEDQDNPPSGSFKAATADGSEVWFRPNMDLALSLDHTTKIHVHKGSQSVTITADEIWAALTAPAFKHLIYPPEGMKNPVLGLDEHGDHVWIEYPEAVKVEMR